jgi:DNA modification methylase
MRFTTPHGSIWNGDCLELMKEIPSGSVDMILCDLPYGTTACKWDAIIPFEPLWREYWRVAKPNAAIVLTAAQPFTTALIASQIERFKYDWIWAKNKGSGHLNANKMPMKNHENICVFSQRQSTYNAQDTLDHKPMNFAVNKQNNINGKHGSIVSGGKTTRKPKSILSFPVVNNDGSGECRIHPTQKPVALFEYLIKTYTNEGETVLDNCSGSGTTAIAAIRSGRRFLCIEKDLGYYFGSCGRVHGELNK